MTDSETSAPEPPGPGQKVQQVAFWVLAGLSVANYVVFGVIHIWAPQLDGADTETSDLIQSALTILGALLGLGALPLLPGRVSR